MIIMSIVYYSAYNEDIGYKHHSLLGSRWKGLYSSSAYGSP